MAAVAAGGLVGKGRDISLAALQRHDPYINRIVDVASQVALYTFGHRANEWVRADATGRAGGAGRGGAGVVRLGPGEPGQGRGRRRPGGGRRPSCGIGPRGRGLGEREADLGTRLKLGKDLNIQEPRVGRAARSGRDAGSGAAALTGSAGRPEDGSSALQRQS